MAAVSGVTGTAAFDAPGAYAHVDLNVRSWNLDYVADVLDVTEHKSSGDRTFKGGFRQWSGTFDCLLDDTEDPLNSTAASLGAYAINLTLTASTSRTYKGTAIVTGIHPSVSADSVNVNTVDFQGSGALAIA